MLLLVPLPPWTEDITTMMTSVHIAPSLCPPKCRARHRQGLLPSRCGRPHLRSAERTDGVSLIDLAQPGKALRPSRRRRHSKLLPPQESFHGLDALLVEASVAIDTCAYSSMIPDAIGILDATSSIAIEICNELIATRLEIRRRLGGSGVRHRGSEDNGDRAQQPIQEWVHSAAHQRMKCFPMSAVMPAVEATMKVKTAMAVEVAEMTEPFEPRPAAIKLLGPNPVIVARTIGVVRTSSFGAGRKSSQQDNQREESKPTHALDMVSLSRDGKNADCVARKCDRVTMG